MPLPDEGLIHAWLDGQLPSDEAARVERLVATDAAWGAAAAEARGLIAASSRILSALDHVPAGIVPKGKATPGTRRLPWWAKAAAAVALMAGGSALVLIRAPEPEIAPVSREADTAGAAVIPSASQSTPPATAQTARQGATKPVVPAGKAQRPMVPNAAVGVIGGVSSDSTTNALVPSGLVVAPAPAAALQAVVVPESQAKGVAAADQAPRLQQSEQARQGAAQARAQHTSVELRREMVMAAAAKEPARNFAAPSPITVRARLTPDSCYELRESRTSAIAGAVMRGDRMQGDTLLLVPVRIPSPARAWVVASDGAVRGVLATEAEGRGMVLVTASPVACPTP
jgi:hypothetical protein